jgi:hypothetical protein
MAARGSSAPFTSTAIVGERWRRPRQDLVVVIVVVVVRARRDDLTAL